MSGLCLHHFLQHNNFYSILYLTGAEDLKTASLTKIILSSLILKMKVLTDYSRVVIHLMDSQYDKLKEYDQAHGEENLRNGMKPIVLVNTSWYYKSDILNDHIKVLNNYEVIVLASTVEEQEFFEREVGLESLHMNHNVFANENEFYIDESVEKQFDMFVNSAFCGYKRLDLTAMIDNIVYVGRFPEKFDVANINLNKKVHFPNFENRDFTENSYRWLSGQEINKLSNQSLMAGIFSPVEGACFSSSQYLLCGLPVISPKCRGGRELFYDENNTIYCELNPLSVLQAVSLMKIKLERGEFNRHQIRATHIALQEKYRALLTEFIIKKLKAHSDKDVIDFDTLKRQLSYYQW